MIFTEGGHLKVLLKNKWFLLIVALLVVVLASFLLYSISQPGQTEKRAGLFTLYFAPCGNGNCQPQQGESYSTCPQDCCMADCTDYQDNVCHMECEGHNGCSFTSGCNTLYRDTQICLDSTHYAVCCSGSSVSCAQDEYCSGGTCLACSATCDDSCSGPECYGIDPDCDASGNPTEACCGNGNCDLTEDCSTCEADCGACPGICGNGICEAGEDYSNCPDDCCMADCTDEGDSTCHSECDVYNGCSITSGCGGTASGTAICIDFDSYVNCCEGTPTDCSATEYCSGGSCLACSTTCDDSCQSVACYGTDPDCDASGNPTEACCGNGTCDGSEDCVSCASDCPGSIVCSSDSDCDDFDPDTTDTCNNPGTCSASCSNISCPIECSSDSGCDDGNPLTADTCNNPGTCSASCSNTPCTADCYSNSDCHDGDPLTADSCVNPGTCDAYCTNLGCPVECATDSDCDDFDPDTTDTCNNPGTCDAYCSNVICIVGCTTDAECDDYDLLTADVCVNKGQCGSYCENSVCEIECSSNADCDDNDPETDDECIDPGDCFSYCIYHRCNIACSSDSDCDDNIPQTVDSCANAGSCNAVCRNEISPMTVELTPPITGTYKRKDTINVRVSVKIENEAVEGATVTVSGPEKEISLTESQLGIYSGNYTIDADAPLGSQKFDVEATKGAKSAETSFETTIEKGEIILNLIEPEDTALNVGREVEFKLEAKYQDGEPVTGLDLNALFNEKEVIFEEIGEGIYSGSYTVKKEDVGDVNFLINVHDQYNNLGSDELTFKVSSIPAFVIDIVTVLGAIFFFISFLIALIILILFTILSLLLFSSKSRKERIMALRAKKLELGLLKNYTRLEYSTKMIKKKHYDELMAKYKQKIAAVENSINFLKREHFWNGFVNQTLNITRKILPVMPSRKTIEKPPKEKKPEPTETDKKIAELKATINLLKQEFYKRRLTEEEFRKRMFDYKSKLHLLELKKKGKLPD